MINPPPCNFCGHYWGNHPQSGRCYHDSNSGSAMVPQCLCAAYKAPPK